MKRYLREKRIKFREVDVSREADEERDLARQGYRGVLVILINNQQIVGFNKQEIDRLLEIR